MTKTEQQRLALALLKARPTVIPGTNVILDDTARDTWYRAVTAVADVIWPADETKGAPSWFFDTAGVPN